MDMIMKPNFVHDLMDRICDWNVMMVEFASRYNFDGIYFGDDWGQQRGLQMGPQTWREFILPQLRRMYGAVRDAGGRSSLFVCGDATRNLEAMCRADCDNVSIDENIPLERLSQPDQEFVKTATAKPWTISGASIPTTCRPMTLPTSAGCELASGTTLPTPMRSGRTR